ncbi:corrinoid methyltransferase [Geomonas sp. Red276]
MKESVAAFKNALLALDRVSAQEVLQESIDRLGVVPTLEMLITASLTEIGRGWEAGELALSQIYMAGRICENLIETFLPLGDPGRKSQPRLAVAVYEDYHMLGKRLVHSVLRSAGYELRDYGRVDLDSTLRLVAEDRVEILLLSVLMLHSALHITELRHRLNLAGLPVRIVVGGAPFCFDQGLWREVGADAMGRNASDAVTILQELTGGGR